MTRATLAQAQAAWGDRVIIWGGIPSAVLCPSTSDEVFERFLEELFGQAVPAGNIILGVGDNVVGDAIIERVERISALVRV